MRAAVNDTRGFVSELLAKAINQGSLDQAITADEKLKLLPFLRRYGDLDERFGFAGTTRSGFSTPPGGRCGAVRDTGEAGAARYPPRQSAIADDAV